MIDLCYLIWKIFFFEFQAAEGLVQISDGSLDDVNISDLVKSVNPEKLLLEIKKELPKNSKLLTNLSFDLLFFLRLPIYLTRATNSCSRLVGAISGFTYAPNIEAGFVDDQGSVFGSNTGFKGQMYPKEVKLSMEYTVFHHRISGQNDSRWLKTCM